MRKVRALKPPTRRFLEMDANERGGHEPRWLNIQLIELDNEIVGLREDKRALQEMNAMLVKEVERLRNLNTMLLRELQKQPLPG